MNRAAGFTLVEVLVALIVVAIGLSALMVAVSGTARTSGYLRDKTIAQWIAMNRLVEVRLNSNNKFAQNTDAGELNFAGRTWHYDTRYYDTSIASMRRIDVRVYVGDAKTKGNALAEATSFLGSALGQVGGSNTDWSVGSTLATAGTGTPGTGTPGTTNPTGTTGTTGTGTTGTGTTGPSVTPTPTPTPQP